MEEKRNFRGLKRYESLLKTVCRIDPDNEEEKEWQRYLGIGEDSEERKKRIDYNKLSIAEWEGCIGVACVISFIEGVSANMFSLSKHLDIPHYNVNLQASFEKLKVNGVFSKAFGAKKDPFLTGCASSTKWRTSAENERNAWCTIAGLASGCIGMKEVPKKEEETKEELKKGN